MNISKRLGMWLVWCISMTVSNYGHGQHPTISTYRISAGNPGERIKPIHGVNGGPFVIVDHASDLTQYHKEAGFPHTRLHDCNWPHPDVVDVPAIFPNFHADVNDPRNYHFKKTDDYLAPIIKNQSKIIYRLGVSIEHRTTYHNAPPEDYEKWAAICANIIRHYNEGWADGFFWNIEYWEIWNEFNLSRMWTGTAQEYYRLYEISAKHLKNEFPNIKIGGPAAAGVREKEIRPFLQYCKDKNIPLDFFSWHRYADNPDDIYQDALYAREILDEFGFHKTENHCNEWHYITSWAKLGTTFGTNLVADYTSVRKEFANTVDMDGALFSINVLKGFQTARVDVANFYSADISPWSMFDPYSNPSKVYYTFKAFNQLAFSNRMNVSSNKEDPDIKMLAGQSNAEDEIKILVWNSAESGKQIKLSFSHRQEKSITGFRKQIIDKENNLSEIQHGDQDLLSIYVPGQSIILLSYTLNNKAKK